MSEATYRWTGSVLTAIFVATLACQSSELHVEQPPINNDIQSVLVLLTQNETTLGYGFAPNVDRSFGVLIPQLEANGEIQVWALGYAKSLNDLGLSAGEFDPRGQDCVVLPDSSWRGVVESEQWSGWTETPPAAPPTGFTWCDSRPACARFDTPVTVSLTTTVAIEVLEPLPEERFLAGDRQGSFFIIEPGGTFAAAPQYADLPHWASSNFGPGRIALGGRRGAVQWGVLDEGLRNHDIPGAQDTVVAIQLSPDLSRAIALSTDINNARNGTFNLNFHLWTNQRWELLGVRKVASLKTARCRVAWVDNENAWIVHGGESVFEVRDRWLSEADGQFTHADAIVVHPMFGPLLGGNGNPVNRRVAGAWDRIPGTDLMRAAYSFANRPQSVLIGYDNFVLWELFPDAPDSCESAAVASSDIEILRTNGRMVAGAGSYAFDGLSPVMLLRELP